MNKEQKNNKNCNDTVIVSMKLNDKYFHSIHSYNIPQDDYEKNMESRLTKLSQILESGMILSKEKIISKYGQGNFHPSMSINGSALVSITRYQNSETTYDKNYKSEVDPKYFENAFQDFALQQFSIVLDASIEKELKMYEAGIYLERQILNAIPLKYMVGISIFDRGELYPFFNRVPVDSFSLYYENGQKFKELCFIMNLLKKYHYNVPVVSIITGNQYYDNIEYLNYINEQLGRGFCESRCLINENTGFTKRI